MPNSASLGLPNPASYDSETTPGVVHDLVTGLDWLQDPGTELYLRADAIGLCAELSFGGFDDWRVPEFIELVSLFDCGAQRCRSERSPIYISSTFRAEGRFWSMSRWTTLVSGACSTSPRLAVAHRSIAASAWRAERTVARRCVLRAWRAVSDNAAALRKPAAIALRICAPASPAGRARGSSDRRLH